jgi:hypothetical protein
MNIRYRVELSQTERAGLIALLAGGKHAVRKLKRAQILWAADAAADKSLINRRLSLHSQPCAAMAFLADDELAEQPLNRASPLDREHKRLAPRSGYNSRAWRRGTKQIPVNRQIVSRHAARGEPLFKAFSDHRT